MNVADLNWVVAHTLPRCEKKLMQHCERAGLSATLPCYAVAHKYRGKTVVFQKPLFPGYVFLRIPECHGDQVYKSGYLAKLLVVTDQILFAAQLDAILSALEARVDIRLVPIIGEGMRVRIKYGPLRG